jgi:hypothetical protein
MVMAYIYILAGKQDLALDTMVSVLAMPRWCTPRMLAIDPVWAPLRGNPRFEKLFLQPDKVFL